MHLIHGTDSQKEIAMRRKAFVFFFVLGGTTLSLAGAFAPRAAAAPGSQCFKVDCNTCCRASTGRVICTEMACSPF